ncbi:hypothetical protein AB0M43_14345 [Longispora sp. NPDC051575]|uniref:hypothetical protein n=1 Tax=Longispora sp. NPDC051575 TaxID=3154943 RepID=UPI0034398612
MIIDTFCYGERYRIASLRLLCGGSYVYWMTRGETYRLRHEGRDWEVAGAAWFHPHRAYRLVRIDSPATAIPDHGGSNLILCPGTEYQISANTAGRWSLHVVDALIPA